MKLLEEKIIGVLREISFFETEIEETKKEFELISTQFWTMVEEHNLVHQICPTCNGKGEIISDCAYSCESEIGHIDCPTCLGLGRVFFVENTEKPLINDSDSSEKEILNRLLELNYKRRHLSETINNAKEIIGFAYKNSIHPIEKAYYLNIRLVDGNIELTEKSITEKQQLISLKF